jgi:hypothetical protein
MLTKMMKWVSIAALLTAFFWRPSASYEILLQFVVCVGAALVVAQAWRAGKYIWGAGFLSIAVLFNPVVPVTLPRGMFLWLDVACLATFLISLAAVRTTPLRSVSGIIHPNRLNESL